MLNFLVLVVSINVMWSTAVHHNGSRTDSISTAFSASKTELITSTFSSFNKTHTFELTAVPTPSRSTTPTVSSPASMSESTPASLSLLASASPSLAESVTVTRSQSLTGSLELPPDPCLDLPVSATFTVVFPDLQRPVQTGFSLESTIIQSPGYEVILNITSCHRFSTAFVESTFDSNRPAKGDEEITATIENEEEDDYSNGFFDVLNADNNFVTVHVDDITSPKSARLKIGPNAAFVLYSKPETVTMSLSAKTFAPESVNQLETKFIIRPLIVSSSKEQEVSDQSSLILSFIAVAVSNPTTATLVGKVDMLANAIDCPNFLEEGQLPIDQNPFRIGFGNERNLYYHTGGVLLNPFAILASVAFHFLVVLIVSWFRSFGNNKKGHLQDTMVSLRFPAFSMILIVFFYQGTIESAVTVFLHSKAAFYSFAAMFVLLAAMVVPAACYLRVHPSKFFALRASTEDPSKRTHAVIRFIFGVGEWIDRGRKSKGFATRYGALFDEFRPKRQWYLAVEFLFLYLFGILDALSPKTRTRCIAVSACMSVSLWIYTVLIVGTHPFTNDLTFTFYVLISVTLLVASLQVTAMHLVENDKAKLKHAAGITLVVAVSITILKTLHDFSLMGYSHFTRKTREQNIERWKTAAKRKVRVARHARQRTNDIERLLENDLDEGFVPEQNSYESNSEQDSLDIPDCDEREPQQIVSSVAAVEECPEATEDEAEIIKTRTGMTKEELWKVL